MGGNTLQTGWTLQTIVFTNMIYKHLNTPWHEIILQGTNIQ